MDVGSKQLAREQKIFHLKIVETAGLLNLAITIAALVIFSGLFFYFSNLQPASAFGLIVGGALGNILDRLPDGRVTDFIPVGVATVNVADLAIWFGIILFLKRYAQTA